MKLRDYQLRTIEGCRNQIKGGAKKVLVYLPTGAGKTVIFSEQVRSAVDRGKKVLVIVRRRQIAFQTFRRLVPLVPSGCIGLYMAQSKQREQVTVASVDTLARCEKEWNYDLIIVDEAHDCTSDSYKKVLDKFEGKWVIGYTATPFRIGNKGHTYWEGVVRPVTAETLRNQGHLVPVQMFCPDKPETHRVPIKRGDYDQKELYRAVDLPKIYSCIVREYKARSPNAPAVCFAVNVQHSESIVESFERAGIPAIHIDADTRQDERDAAIASFIKYTKLGRPFVLSNVNIFSTGVDIPCIRTVIMARPTRSLVLYLQQLGRGLRPYNGKSHCTVLDHGGNCLLFGSPYRNFEPELTDKAKGLRNMRAVDICKSCKACSAVLPIRADTCSFCGAELATHQEVVQNKDINLTEFLDETTRRECDEAARRAQFIRHRDVLRVKLAGRYPSQVINGILRKKWGRTEWG